MVELNIDPCPIDDLAGDVAVRLRSFRLEHGLTQAEVARRADLQASSVAHFESGRRSPSIANLKKLCGALGVSADALLGIARPDGYEWHMFGGRWFVTLPGLNTDTPERRGAAGRKIAAALQPDTASTDAAKPSHPEKHRRLS